MNDNDDLLRELLDESPDEADPARDPRYEALTEGRLTREEDAALRALGDTSPRHAQAYAAYKPVSNALRAELFAKAGLVDPLAAPSAKLEPAAAPAPDPAKSFWSILRARLSAWRLVPTLATAVVAALLLWPQPAVPPFQHRVANLFPSAAPSMMGASDGGQFVHAGTVIEVSLVPTQAPDTSLELRASAFALQGETAVRIEGATKAASGGFRFELPADKVIDALDAGPATLVFFVAAEEDLPKDGDAAVAAEESRSLAVVRVPVTLP